MRTLPASIRSSISFQPSRSPLLGQLWIAPPPGFLNLPLDRLIDERFDHIDRNLYGGFNAQRLNESFYMTNSTLNNGNSTGPRYMFATWRAYNATDVNEPPGTTPTNNNGGDESNQPGGKKKSLAMSVLTSSRVWHRLIPSYRLRYSTAQSRTNYGDVHSLS